ncbi:hypothetical protein SAMN05216278_1314 [Halopelagius longus]|uniref:Uncharacterized protein n=2 Tax=Halopelagius longus TaxID=1236180 RepID=A0A1H1AGX8_9EURY|nr:hypothetical protein SAMN05216278_1314 [Halopelagius longus]
MLGRTMGAAWKPALVILSVGLGYLAARVIDDERTSEWLYIILVAVGFLSLTYARLVT